MTTPNPTRDRLADLTALAGEVATNPAATLAATAAYGRIHTGRDAADVLDAMTDTDLADTARAAFDLAIAAMRTVTDREQRITRAGVR